MNQCASRLCRKVAERSSDAGVRRRPRLRLLAPPPVRARRAVRPPSPASDVGRGQARQAPHPDLRGSAATFRRPDLGRRRCPLCARGRRSGIAIAGVTLGAAGYGTFLPRARHPGRTTGPRHLRRWRAGRCTSPTWPWSAPSPRTSTTQVDAAATARSTRTRHNHDRGRTTSRRAQAARVAVPLLGEPQMRRLRAAGTEVIVGTCPDLGVVQPIAQPLRTWARHLSRHMAAGADGRGGGCRRYHRVPRRPARARVRRGSAERPLLRGPFPSVCGRLPTGHPGDAPVGARRPRPAHPGPLGQCVHHPARQAGGQGSRASRGPPGKRGSSHRGPPDYGGAEHRNLGPAAACNGALTGTESASTSEISHSGHTCYHPVASRWHHRGQTVEHCHPDRAFAPSPARTQESPCPKP